MPELPEVETIRRDLRAQVIGCEIIAAIPGDLKVFQFDHSVLEREICGQKIQRLLRRGKYLAIELERYYLVFHLGMTGQLTLRDPERKDPGGFLRHEVTGLQRAVQHPPDSHTHLQILFANGKALMFRDVRKFGKIFLLKNVEGVMADFLSHLGIEPFTDDYRLEPFLEKMDKRKVKVKSLLLDQRFVAGVGNIYADEALFRARIRPTRMVRCLRRYEKVRLFEAIPVVLEKGIQYGGTTLRDYVNGAGQEGRHQERLNVYGREGEPCRKCGSLIKKIVVSQRGTHFCPQCQKR